MQEPVRVSELIGESEMISPPQPLDDLAHRDPKAKVSCWKSPYDHMFPAEDDCSGTLHVARERQMPLWDHHLDLGSQRPRPVAQVGNNRPFFPIPTSKLHVDLWDL